MDRKPRIVWPVTCTPRAALAVAALLVMPHGALARAAQPEPDAAPAQAQLSDTPEEEAHKTDRDKSEKDDDTLDKAGRIASQPVRDVGITKNKIPVVLQEAVSAPYAALARQTCTALDQELTRLDEALGPDFDGDRKKNENKAEQIALAGGEMVVNSLIPFRGLVREISGAAPADRRKAAAVNAGLARRGYLRGLAASRNCRRLTPSAIAAK